MYIIHLIFFLICEIVLSMQTSTFLLYSDLRHLSTWLYEHLSCFLIAVFNFIISIDHHLANPLHTYFFIFLFLPQLVCFMLLPQKQGKTMLWWMSFIYIGKKTLEVKLLSIFKTEVKIVLQKFMRLYLPLMVCVWGNPPNSVLHLLLLILSLSRRAPEKKVQPEFIILTDLNIYPFIFTLTSW